MKLSNIQTNKQFTNKIFTTIEMYKDTNYNIAKELNWIELNATYSLLNQFTPLNKIKAEL